MSSQKSSNELLETLRSVCSSSSDPPLWVIDAAEAAADRIEELEKEAARYRWLRHGDNDEGCILTAYTSIGQEYAYLLRGEKLDEYIDEAMAKEQQA